MMLDYNKVPCMITGKDLDYLSDMFNWSYSALKTVSGSISKVSSKEILSVLNKSYDLFNNNLKDIIIIINGGICD